MEFVELTDNDYILKFSLSDEMNGYMYCREIFNTICRKYPEKTFVAIPSNIDLITLTKEELEDVKEKIDEILEEMKETESS